MLVGLGSCAFTLISAYGFADVLDPGVTLDPARIAAQIVSGIGFLGAGVIFKGRDVVRGLTTAATIWVAAAVGMACGAGMVSLAVALAIFHLIPLFLVAVIVRGTDSSEDDDDAAGRGVGSAAVAYAVAVARTQLGLHRLQAATLPHNAASQRIPRLGGRSGMLGTEVTGG